MPNKNLWNKNVPRVEYDLRARDARLRLERVERLLVKRDATAAAAAGFRYFRLLSLLISNVAGNGRKRQRTGSPSDRRPCCISGYGRPTSAAGA
jgi:hypothetical protein